MQIDLARRVSAEFFGTFWLTFGGCGAAVLADVAWGADTEGGVWAAGGGGGVAFERVLLGVKRA